MNGSTTARRTIRQTGQGCARSRFILVIIPRSSRLGILGFLVPMLLLVTLEQGAQEQAASRQTTRLARLTRTRRQGCRRGGGLGANGLQGHRRVLVFGMVLVRVLVIVMGGPFRGRGRHFVVVVVQAMLGDIECGWTRTIGRGGGSFYDDDTDGGGWMCESSLENYYGVVVPSYYYGVPPQQLEAEIQRTRHTPLRILQSLSLVWIFLCQRNALQEWKERCLIFWGSRNHASFGWGGPFLAVAQKRQPGSVALVRLEYRSDRIHSKKKVRIDFNAAARTHSIKKGLNLFFQLPRSPTLPPGVKSTDCRGAI